MKLGIVGKKVGMTQVFDEAGGIVPVTVIDTSHCQITQVKTKDTDGYAAVQIGFGTRKPQNVNKALSGHFKKAGIAPAMLVREIRFETSDDLTQLKAGQKILASTFQKGDRVDIAGIVKGRGFAGVMKKLHYHGKHATHGTSKYFRHGGSNGSNTFPGRVLKNKGMPGQMGNWKRTTINLEVFDVKPEENLILVRGTVPGAKNGTLVLRSTNRKPQPDRAIIVQ